MFRVARASQGVHGGVGGQPLLCQERLGMGRGPALPSSLLQGLCLEGGRNAGVR